MANEPENNDSGSQTTPQTPTPGKRARARRMLLIAGVVVAIGATIFGIRWWVYGRFMQTTDDAYLRADSVTISPNVTGLIESVYVAENQSVRAGAALVKVDSRSYQASLEQANATVAGRKADIERAEAALVQQQATIRQAEATLSASSLAADFAGKQVIRYAPLSQSGAETNERLEQLQDQRDQARARQRSDAAALDSAKRQVPSLEASISQAKAQLESAEATVRQSNIDLGHTTVRSSIDGRIGDSSVRVGQFVQPGTRLMSVVPVGTLYVTANFKENQIGRMRIGQTVHIKVDAVPHADITGKLASFAPGTGAQFALLPPENATGNFTKIVQRVPVRTTVYATQAVRALLVPGLSATVTVDTRGTDDVK
jgi:membrane fusion protein, multidrug efflux system